MLERIRKHQKWLWFLLIIVVIIAFVIFFTPTIGRGPRIRHGVVGIVLGRQISTEEFISIQREVQLAFFLRYNVWPDSLIARQADFDPVAEAKQRLLLIELARQAGIKVDDKAIAEWVRTHLGDPQRPGLAREIYQKLIDSELLRRAGIGPKEFNEFIRHEVMISQLLDTISTFGQLVTPREAMRRYQDLNEKFITEAIVLELTNYLAQVQPTPEDLLQYYSNHINRYSLPERRSVYYVKFPLTNYLANAEAELANQPNLQQLLEQEYQRRGTNSFLNADGTPLSPEEAKKQLMDELKQQRAQIFARKAASEFGQMVWNIEPWSVQNLLKVASDSGINIHELEPFSQSQPPKEPPLSHQAIQVIFELTDEKPFTGPILLSDGVYMFGLKEKIPPQTQPFEQVKEQLEQQYRREKAMELLMNAATQIKASLTNALAAGQSFEQAVQALGFSPVKLPEFSLSSGMPDNWDQRIMFSTVQSAVRNLGKGQLSDPLPARDGRCLIYVIERVTPSSQQDRNEIIKLVHDMAQANRMQAFQEWFEYKLRTEQIRFSDEERRSPTRPTK